MFVSTLGDLGWGRGWLQGAGSCGVGEGGGELVPSGGGRGGIVGLAPVEGVQEVYLVWSVCDQPHMVLAAFDMLFSLLGYFL